MGVNREALQLHAVYKTRMDHIAAKTRSDSLHNGDHLPNFHAAYKQPMYVIEPICYNGTDSLPASPSPECMHAVCACMHTAKTTWLK